MGLPTSLTYTGCVIGEHEKKLSLVNQQPEVSDLQAFVIIILSFHPMWVYYPGN